MTIEGNTALGNAFVDGVTTAKLRHELAVVKEELRVRKLAEAREGVKKPRELQELQQKLEDARLDYGGIVAPTGLRKALLIAYGLICFGVDTAYKHLAAINREA